MKLHDVMFDPVRAASTPLAVHAITTCNSHFFSSLPPPRRRPGIRRLRSTAALILRRSLRATTTRSLYITLAFLAWNNQLHHLPPSLRLPILLRLALPDRIRPQHDLPIDNLDAALRLDLPLLQIL